jgi:hypothetical protein
MQYIALMHDEKTECAYPGYARQKWSGAEIEFPHDSGSFQPITHIGIADSVDAPVSEIAKLWIPVKEKTDKPGATRFSLRIERL